MSGSLIGSVGGSNNNVLIQIRVNSAQAQTAFATLRAQLGELSKYGQELDASFRNVDRTLRYMAAGAVVALTGAFVTLAGELERQVILLSTLESSIQKANDRMDQLVSLASKVPFSLTGITDAFVKLKVAGLEPIIDNEGNGPLRNLLDALAAFGGTEQQLQRASIAIQQMAGKGVVSLEELRQQLGEAIPTAIRAMAAGMGISISELIDKISKGNVTFREGVNAMLAEFERNYRGAGELLNNTFFGAIRQLKTELDRLVLTLNRGGALDVFTIALQGLQRAFASLNESLSSGAVSTALDNFQNWVSTNARGIGQAATAVSAFGSALSALAGFIGEVLSAMPAEAIAGGLIGWVLAGRFGLVAGGLLGVIMPELSGILSAFLSWVTEMRTGAAGAIGTEIGELATYGLVGFLLFGKRGGLLGVLVYVANEIIGWLRKVIAEMGATIAGFVAGMRERSMWTSIFGSSDEIINQNRRATAASERARAEFLANNTGPGSTFGPTDINPLQELFQRNAGGTTTATESVQRLNDRFRELRENIRASREEFNGRFGTPNPVGGLSQEQIEKMVKFQEQLERVLDRQAGSTGRAIDGWVRQQNRIADQFQETVDSIRQAREVAQQEGRSADVAALDRELASATQRLELFRKAVREVKAADTGPSTAGANATLQRWSGTVDVIRKEIEAFQTMFDSGRNSEASNIAQVNQRFEQLENRLRSIRAGLTANRGEEAKQAEIQRELTELQEKLNAARERGIEIAKRKAEWEREDAQRQTQRTGEDLQRNLRLNQLELSPLGGREADILQRQASVIGSIRQVDDQIRELERRQLERGAADPWLTQWLENLRRVKEGFQQLYDQIGTFAEAEARRSKELFDSLASGMENAFQRGLEVLISGTGSLKDVLKAFFQDITRSVSKYLTDFIFRSLSEAAGGGAGGGSAGGSLLGALLGGAGKLLGGASGGTFSLGKAIGMIGSGAMDGGAKAAEAIVGGLGAIAAKGALFEGRMVQAFAGGGAFTNKIVSGPTLFNMGLMGERGPEGILPLARVGGRLGVHATGGGDNYSINIQAVDAASVRQLFYREGDALMGSLSQRSRLNRGIR